MSDPQSPIAVLNHGPIKIVEFTQNRILDEANIAEIGTKVGEVIEAESRPRLILDFRNVDHLSSAALGMLINANNKVKDKNGQLRLCDIRRQIMEVFSITKLDKLFKILPDRQAAIHSFELQRTDVS